jgi:hypothetical protein
MMSFLTYITGFFINFELLPILTAIGPVVSEEKIFM